MLVKLFNENMKEIEKEINWNDENEFEFSDDTYFQWEVGKLASYNVDADLKYEMWRVGGFKYCREIKKRKRIKC